jgi:predicted enzyme related to lactoylglutathione lyase
MGPDAVYTMFQIDGRNAAACFTLQSRERAQGIPPHWQLYVAVNDADQAAAKIAPSGGMLVEGPFDVMDFGRMVVLRDSTGAFVSMWQSKTHPGIGIEHVPGTLSWADLITPDQDRAARFYRQVFGWEMDPGREHSGYLHIRNGDKHIGGIPPAGPGTPPGPPHWLVYFRVQDCDRSAAQAQDLGATVLAPSTAMEGVGRWSVLADPQGAAFAVFQPAHH